jgi:hypothetical protein
MPLVPVPLGDGITVELPDEWTPVIDLSGRVDDALAKAWVDYTVAITPPEEKPALWLNQWPNLLFWQWQENVFELAERELQADAPLTVLNIYPPSERHIDNFTIERGRLVHWSGRVHFDPHYRVRTVVVERTAPVGAHATAAESHPRRGPQQGGTKRDRAKIFYAVAQPEAGSLGWITLEVLRKARADKRYKDSPLLQLRGDDRRSYSPAWTLAKQWLREGREPPAD